MMIVYIDGACSPNPGTGGWGVHVKDGDEVHEWSGGEHQTTNNRMELAAAINALRNLSPNEELRIISDSQYVVMHLPVQVI